MSRRSYRSKKYTKKTKKSPCRKTKKSLCRKTKKYNYLSPCRVPSKSRIQKMSTTKIQEIARSLETKARNLRMEGRIIASDICNTKRSQLLENALLD